MKKSANRKMKKIALVVFGIIAVAAVSVGATFAYLTDSATARNTFTVGQVKISLDEKDTDGSTSGKERDQANVYHLLPGEKYEKDPTIHVDPKSEDCWLFVKVENGIASIEAPTEQVEDGYKTIAEQIEANGWTALEDEKNVYYREYTKPTEDVGIYDFVVFNEFKIFGDVSNDTLKDAGKNVITITGYAVQKAGLDSAPGAWSETFGKQVD